MNVRTRRPIVYPESDGQPMAENTLQYDMIVLIKENLTLIFADHEDVFVAADNLIYPVEGDPKTRTAPDVYVAIGRPKQDRGCYKVWEEGGIFPQVIFEVLSPGNRGPEMARKFSFYERFGAEEYYIIDPDEPSMSGWLREDGRLREVTAMQGFISPRTGMRFELIDSEFRFQRPGGEPFLSFEEVFDQLNKARTEHRITEGAWKQAEAARQRAETEKQQSETARQQAEAETARLRALLDKHGITPDSA